MALKGKPISIGTSDTTIYTCPATTEASIHGLVFANNTGSSVTITLKVYIQSTASTTTVATGITVAANSTYTWPKPIDVNAGDYVQAAASTGSAIVCLYSVYEGSATAAAVGFTPRGAWSSGSNYAVNDVVSYSGSSYLAILANSNYQPNTSTAQWLLLASKGDTGAAGTGSGDVTGPSSSVDSELALFDSTTGKVIKRASLTGIVKATSGVASAATAGTDYQAAISATGILKGAGGGSVSAATAGTDYIAPPSGTAILKANSGGALANAVAGTDYQAAISASGVLKGDGSGGVSSATAGTDYQAAISASGLLKGAGGGSVSAATAGTDYLAPPSGTALLKANSGGALANATAGTDYQAAISATGILKGAGSGSVSAATAGTDYQAAITASGVLKGDGAGGVSAAAAGTDFQAVISATGLLKGAGSGSVSAATAGTDYLAPAAIGVSVQAYDADLDTWATKTAPSGTVVGTSDTQTLTGKTITGVKETKTAPSISSGTLTLDCSAGNVFAVSLNANITTLSFSNVPSTGTAYGLTLALTADGTARTITWGSAVKWPSGTAPTLTSTNAKVDTFILYTHDGGTTWYAFTGGQNA